MAAAGGVEGAWGYPEGGMGAVTQAMARSAQVAGAEIYTDQVRGKNCLQLFTYLGHKTMLSCITVIIV